MQGLRTWEEDSLGVDDSITNYTLHPPFLFFFFFTKGKKFDRDSIWDALIYLCKLLSNFLEGGEV